MPRDGFLGMVGRWDAEHFGGVKQGVLEAKPEELILGAYNTPFLLLWLPGEPVKGEEGKTISPLEQGSSPGWGLLSASSFPSSAGRSVRRRPGAGQSWLLASCHLLFGTVLLQVLLI